MSKMIPYTPTPENTGEYQPALLSHGYKLETRKQMEARGIVFTRREDLDGMIWNQAGPAFEVQTFGEEGIFCEQQ